MAWENCSELTKFLVAEFATSGLATSLIDPIVFGGVRQKLICKSRLATIEPRLVAQIEQNESVDELLQHWRIR